MQIVMNVPFTAVHFATYESAKTAMARWAGREQEEETLLVQLLAGQAPALLELPLHQIRCDSMGEYGHMKRTRTFCKMHAHHIGHHQGHTSGIHEVSRYIRTPPDPWKLRLLCVLAWGHLAAKERE